MWGADGKVIYTDARPIREKSDEKGGSDEQKEWQDVHDTVEDLNVRLARHFEDRNDNNAWDPPMIKSPPQPTKEEWMRHQLTHTPYASWCRHCISARAIRSNHQRADKRAKLVPDTNRDNTGPTQVSMDYMYMHDRVGKYKDGKWNPPYLIVVEHKYGRTWAYQKPNKGHHDESSWLPTRLIQDWYKCGLKDIAIRLKTDQEPSMVSLQRAVQSLRPKEVIPVNSPVGESESNGRVENAIRRIQEKSRVLRHQLEENMMVKLPDSSPVMAWLIRWAAELLSKYSCGDGGKSPHERLHGDKCTTPLVPFGESVFYLPLKTMKRDKGDVAKRPGIWLGIIARTQETLIGTEKWNYQM